MSNADGDFDIYVVDWPTGARKRLTDSPERDGTPVWSPDGKTIAYQTFVGGVSQVWLMDADGGNKRPLLRDAFWSEHPYWSADGSRILISSRRPRTPADTANADLFSVRPDGSDLVRHTATDAVETFGSFSPDGKRIVFRRVLSESDWAVVILDLASGAERIVAPAPGLDAWPFWAPDGHRVVFSSDRSGGSFDLYVWDERTDKVTRLTQDNARDERQPWWSADGKTILYASYEWFSHPTLYESSEIWSIDAP